MKSSDEREWVAWGFANLTLPEAIRRLHAVNVDRKARGDEPLDEPPFTGPRVAPHTFRRRGWRFWICTHCFAPRHMHPRRMWVRSRPHGENYYLSASAPHFKEGW